MALKNSSSIRGRTAPDLYLLTSSVHPVDRLVCNHEAFCGPSHSALTTGATFDSLLMMHGQCSALIHYSESVRYTLTVFSFQP